MAPQISAAVLLYRRRRDGTEVLLVHPGGPFWAKKDLGAWSLPKGEIAEGEPALEAATREFREETGLAVDGEFTELKPVKQKGGKTVLAWAVEGDFDPSQLRSNTFSIEWPPRSGTFQAFPEVDRAAWFALPEARNRILAGQTDLLDQLARLLE
ncbi:MAG: NUDIX domain-containing protein [Acidobacteria bacterium]|nr:NUDIX domain-containing protein [Acidobacteriota bacterium]